MAAVMLFFRQTTGKTERHTHFCIPLEPVFTRDCGGRVHFTDEPTGNLDSRASDEIMALLREANQRYRQTIIMITHNPELAKQAERVLVIEDGRVSRGKDQALHDLELRTGDVRGGAER